MAVQINGTTGITTPKLDALDLELGSKNVVERGSNANGEYVRFADGTQICYQFIVSSSAGAVVWNFPAVFASATIRFAFTAQDSNAVVVTSEGSPLVGSIALSAFNHLNARVNAINLRGMAIGRWF